ncbi:MAG: hypothetical protein DSZ32_03780, partial [Gammaproteobacteria bacterium]
KLKFCILPAHAEFSSEHHAMDDIREGIVCTFKKADAKTNTGLRLVGCWLNINNKRMRAHAVAGAMRL